MAALDQLQEPRKLPGWSTLKHLPETRLEIRQDIWRDAGDDLELHGSFGAELLVQLDESAEGDRSVTERHPLHRGPARMLEYGGVADVRGDHVWAESFERE